MEYVNRLGRALEGRWGRQQADGDGDRFEGDVDLLERDADLFERVQFDLEQQHPQAQSPLFARVPAEVRALIFRFALAEYVDPQQLYPNNSPCRRPGQRGPPQVSTSLLRTCRRVYHEAWFFPFLRADHTFYLTWDERRPARRLSDERLQHALRVYHARHGYVELESVTFVAQLCELEPGGSLQHRCDWDHFHPRCITVVLRHSDWWEWEWDVPMRIEPPFANESLFPASVREIRMELESTVRRRDQVEAIAAALRATWTFRRRDGVRLTPVPPPRWTLSWTGSSEWIAPREHFPYERPAGTTVQEYFVETVRFRSARLDAEEQAAQAPNNPSLDLNSDPAWRTNAVDEASKPPVLHMAIGRID